MDSAELADFMRAKTARENRKFAREIREKEQRYKRKDEARQEKEYKLLSINKEPIDVQFEHTF